MRRQLVLLTVMFLLGQEIALAQHNQPTATPQTPPPDREACLACHGEKDISGETERGKRLNLYVEESELKESIHKDLECVDCHGGARTWDESPHNDGKPLTLLCGNCHQAEHDAYEKSIHGLRTALGDTTAASCGSCHGRHRILPSSDPRSTTNKFRLHETCAACHQKSSMLETHEIQEKKAVPHYLDSIHGRALITNGLIVAPTCNDCHGVHDILPRSHPGSRVSRDRVPKTCGKCHVLVEDVYNQSIHGQLLLKHDARGPVCTSCHTSHEISLPSDPEFRLKSDQTCGKCHADRLKNYRETFHGKALALGRPEVAACYDCHGHHDIQAGTDPRSRISPQHRLETCRKCHPKANANFAAYIVHADHTNKKDYPQLYYVFLFMTLLLVGTFVFFALHSVFWLVRSVVLYMRDSKAFREHKDKIKQDREEFIRFNPLDRFLHALVISSFLLLVITGMPLKFFYTGWAKWMLHVMGGQAVAAVLHRLGALITIFYFSVHVLSVITHFFSNISRFRNPKTGRFQVRRVFADIMGPDSPMPTWQDVKDIIAHNKWFLGRGEKPQFDRWTYWEKFDYLAVFWGVAIIGTSGLIMWIPEQFTRFLPGWIINVALIVHSDEALLAAGFIFTFHFFNVHFRPEKFPMDPVIFSGRISKAELLHERKKLYDRWQAEGRLEQYKVTDDWEARKRIALPLGFIAFLMGLALVLLIYYAMAIRVFG